MNGFYYVSRILHEKETGLIELPYQDQAIYNLLYSIARWCDTPDLLQGDVKTTYSYLRENTKVKKGSVYLRLSTCEIYKSLERLQKKSLISLAKYEYYEYVSYTKAKTGCELLKRKRTSEIKLSVCHYIGSNNIKAKMHKSKINNVLVGKATRGLNNTSIRTENE
jgi:hypothetical protein